MSRTTVSSTLVVAIAMLWCAVTGVAALGLWYASLFLSLGLFAAHLALGCSHDGRLDLRLWAFPIGTWLVSWAVAFAAADRLLGPPEGLLLGFHPSFAMILIFYWLVGSVLLAGGYYLMRDRWLSAERWHRFTEVVRQGETDGRLT